PTSHPMHGKPYDVIYRYLADKYLKPVPSITAVVERFCEKHAVGQDSIAVHVRGTDKKREVTSLDDLNRAYFARIDSLNPAAKIFLFTDDNVWLDLFRQRYGARIAATECERTSGIVGVHS